MEALLTNHSNAAQTKTSPSVPENQEPTLVVWAVAAKCVTARRCVLQAKIYWPILIFHSSPTISTRVFKSLPSKSYSYPPSFPLTSLWLDDSVLSLFEIFSLGLGLDHVFFRNAVLGNLFRSSSLPLSKEGVVQSTLYCTK
jgi:hypothetical protein